ncbi:AI-2E family transporter [Natrialba sp. SSL1]|uniref:AI-2E family transporter n=1 Tax=Natrialba sp. SSL1 TaxID=1869245 RepID=UPI0008F8782F|nr:AI-2E family transporter [Natrialba sp. SSL1]OIB57687.1 AI-2E family transporter [Natrialba sp. SSL1]
MNISKGYLLTLVLIFAYLSWQLVVPFLQYVLLAVLLAFLLFPLQQRLESYISPMLSALALVLLAIVGFIVPFLLVAAVIADDAANLLQSLDADTLQVSELESTIEEQTGMEVDLLATAADSAQEVGTMVLEQATAWFSALTHALIGLGLALFLLYYLLKNGDDLLEWIREMTPLPMDVQDDLYGELNDVMWAVLVGHVLIAIIEGVIAGLALFVVGIPNAAFWTFIMVILSLVPLIGAPLVWIPASIYLVVIGEPLLAAGLAIYSAIVVGVADDYLRPVVVDRYAEISPAVIILGVLGGIYAFGIMGLFFGPVVVGALITVLEVLDEDYDRLEEEHGMT